MSQGKVFVDASFWITRRDKRDERQIFAEAVAHDLFRRRLSLVSTSFVFAEVHAYFSRSRLVGQVVIRDFFENPILHYENPTINPEIGVHPQAACGSTLTFGQKTCRKIPSNS